MDSNQISFFDLFNEAETLLQPVNVEPDVETVVKEHSRMKSKRGSKFDNLPVEVIEYKLDDTDLVCDERHTLRQNKSRAIFDEFYDWIYSTESKTLPQSLVGKAITYAINQKEYLGSLLLDARIQLSNNLAEQSVKPFVIDRKNWLFSNTANGATSSTIIYSIIQTAIANDLIYLEYVFIAYNQGVKKQDYS